MSALDDLVTTAIAECKAKELAYSWEQTVIQAAAELTQLKERLASSEMNARGLSASVEIYKSTGKQLRAALDEANDRINDWADGAIKLSAELAKLRAALYQAKLSIQGGILICKAFLEIKNDSDEKDEPIPNVIQWLEDAAAWLEKCPTV